MRAPLIALFASLLVVHAVADAAPPGASVASCESLLEASEQIVCVYIDAAQKRVGVREVTARGQRELPAKGLPVPENDPIVMTWATPDGWAVSVGGEIYATRDGGATFTLFFSSQRLFYVPTSMRFFRDSGSQALHATHSAFAAVGGSELIVEDGKSVPVVGAGTYSQGFLFTSDPRTSPAVLIASPIDPTEPVVNAEMVVWSCTPALTCTLPVATIGGNGAFLQTSELLGTVGAYAVVKEDDGSTRVQRSSADFQQWGPWASLNRLLEPYARRSGFLGVGIRSTGGGRQIVVRLAHSARDDALPSEQIFRSTDGGTTWRRLGFAYRYSTRRGELPFDNSSQSLGASLGQLAIRPSGELVVLSGTRGAPGAMWCSSHSVTRWARC